MIMGMSPYDYPDVIRLAEWPTSADLRREVAGTDVVLSFSRGKDSIAAWLALLDAGARVHPYYMYLVPERLPDGTMAPGMPFERESIAYFEQVFGTRILQLPHTSTWRFLRFLVYQAPHRAQVLDAAHLSKVPFDLMNTIVKEHYGLPADTWVVDGVRAADSPNRRTSMLRFGPNNGKRRKFRAVYDWRKKHVMAAITDAGIELPVDYRIWGRSFDGLDYRFTGPMAEHLPADFAVLRRWFPMLSADIFRQQLKARYLPTRKAA